jgi:TonB-dependent receptor
MPIFKVIAAAVVLLSVTALGAVAQDGAVVGTITDAESGEALPGANVIVEGTSRGTATNVEGEYRINGVRAGQRVIVVRYIGYAEARDTVLVPAGQAVRADFALRFATLMGEEIEVTAQLEGQAEAINRQLAASTIVNVVSSDKIEELPDQNAAEAIGRLPGISVQREAGEGTKISVRGLSPRFNSVTVNGERLPGADGEDRSVDLSSIPPEVLGGIEVYKALRPDQDADAIGGTVNLSLRPARRDLRLNIRAQAGYNDISEALGEPFKVSGRASDRFWDNRIGFQVSASAERAIRDNDELDVNYIAGEELGTGALGVQVERVQFADVLRTRDRYGASGVFDYELENGQIFLNAFANFSQDEELRRRRRYNVEQGTVQYDFRNRNRDRLVLSSSFNGEHLLRENGLMAEWRTSYSRSRSALPYQHSGLFTEGSAFDATLDPTLGVGEVIAATNNRLENTIFQRALFEAAETVDQSATIQGDLTQPFQVGESVSGFFKTGAKFRGQDRSRDNDRFETPGTIENFLAEYDPEALTGFTLNEAGQVVIIDFFDGDFDANNFLGGDFPFGSGLNGGALDAFYAAYDTLYVQQTRAELDDYGAQEGITSGYVMSEVNLGTRWMVLGGVRYEHTASEYTAKVGRTDGGGSLDDIQEVSDSQTYGEILPMLHVRYKATRWFDARAAVTRTLSRPDFYNLVPYVELNVFERDLRRGNPDLKHTKALNFDLFGSFYQNRYGLFTVGLFYKRLEDIDFIRRSRVAEQGPLLGFDLRQPENAVGIGTVAGLELDLQTNLSWLPGALGGVVLGANYSFVDSRTFVPFAERGERAPDPPFQREQIAGEREIPVPGQSDHTVNVTLGYERYGFSGRISMLYQSDFLLEVGSSQALDEFRQDLLRFDASFQQDLPLKGLRVYVSLNNITNALDESFVGSSRFPTEREIYGFTIDAGVRYGIKID